MATPHEKAPCWQTSDQMIDDIKRVAGHKWGRTMSLGNHCRRPLFSTGRPSAETNEGMICPVVMSIMLPINRYPTLHEKYTVRIINWRENAKTKRETNSKSHLPSCRQAATQE